MASGHLALHEAHCQLFLVLCQECKGPVLQTEMEEHCQGGHKQVRRQEPGTGGGTGQSQSPVLTAAYLLAVASGAHHLAPVLSPRCKVKRVVNSAFLLLNRVYLGLPIPDPFPPGVWVQARPEVPVSGKVECSFEMCQEGKQERRALEGSHGQGQPKADLSLLLFLEILKLRHLFQPRGSPSTP